MNKAIVWRLIARGFETLAAVSLLSLLVLSVISYPAQGQISPETGKLINQELETGAKPAFVTGAAANPLPEVVGNYIRVFLSLLGVIALVLVVYAGYLWMTAGGNEEQVGKAKNILKQSIIGLVIITLAFAITNFVIGSIINAAK